MVSGEASLEKPSGSKKPSGADSPGRSTFIAAGAKRGATRGRRAALRPATAAAATGRGAPWRPVAAPRATSAGTRRQTTAPDTGAGSAAGAATHTGAGALAVTAEG